MKITIDHLRAMAENGLTLAQAIAAFEAQAKCTEIKLTKNAERQRRYREKVRYVTSRNAEQAKSNGYDRHVASRDASLSLFSSSSLTSSEDRKKQERLSLVALGREFHETFWPVYPNKVAKPAALKSFLKARKRVSLETIMAGLERYANKTDDRHWANGSTWLNNDRWEDEIGPSQEKPLTAAAIEKQEHELRLRLHGQGLDPYEIEQEVRRSAALGAQRPGNITQLRPPGGMARG